MPFLPASSRGVILVCFFVMRHVCKKVTNDKASHRNAYRNGSRAALTNVSPEKTICRCDHNIPVKCVCSLNKRKSHAGSRPTRKTKIRTRMMFTVLLFRRM